MKPRRWSLLLLLAGVAVARTPAGAESAQVTLDYVAHKAEERASKPFRSPKADLPAVLRQDNLDYDKYREIHFRHDNALWAREGLPFHVEFFHPGYLYQEPVHVNEFTLTHAQPVRFVQDFFDYGKLKIQKQIPADTGYAGFRLLYPLNAEDKYDELGAFLGASYFRLLGRGQRYGQSARGLAVDCGEPDRPEEFPIFTDWWLGKPHRDDNELRLYALLDSVSCAGAYEFVIKPGETTVVDIDVVLFFRTDSAVHAANPARKPLKTLGQAPLTSMFWFGKASERRFDDYRPEVHDSDGLMLHLENGETLWRPLVNPARMSHQVFKARNVRGFGLFQRERSFGSYEDIFNPYQLVPSAWVVPRGNWGEGAVHLVELSTTYEGLDNIVAFWEPAAKPLPMQPFRYGYTLLWTRETDTRLSPNRVTATRVGQDAREGRRRQFVIDFDGPKLDVLPETDPPVAIASCSDNGAIVENQVFRNTAAGTWRVILKLEPKSDDQSPVDLRCTLKKGNDAVSETWSYHWSPP